MNEVINALDRARQILGSYEAIGTACGVSGKAVQKWRTSGRMPRTEYTGETRYSEIIDEVTGGAVKVAELRPAMPRKLVMGNPNTGTGPGGLDTQGQ